MKRRGKILPGITIDRGFKNRKHLGLVKIQNAS
jgi:hypothetical protein